MTPIIQAKNIPLTPSLREQIQEYLEKLSRRYSKLQKISASIHKEGGEWFSVLLRARVPGKSFVIRDVRPTLPMAITESFERLARAIRKNKEKRLRGRKGL